MIVWNDEISYWLGNAAMHASQKFETDLHIQIYIFIFVEMCVRIIVKYVSLANKTVSGYASSITIAAIKVHPYTHSLSLSLHIYIYICMCLLNLWKWEVCTSCDSDQMYCLWHMWAKIHRSFQLYVKGFSVWIQYLLCKLNLNEHEHFVHIQIRRAIMQNIINFIYKILHWKLIRFLKVASNDA